MKNERTLIDFLPHSHKGCYRSNPPLSRALKVDRKWTVCKWSVNEILMYLNEDFCLNERQNRRSQLKHS